MAPLLTACGGFLLAVLWMDLIFDVQVWKHRGVGEELPEPVLTSIAAYYHRATTTSRPMGRLIALVMVILLVALAFQAIARQRSWLAAGEVGNPRRHPDSAGPDAHGPLRRSARVSAPTARREQTRLARSICRDHLICAACMLAFLVLWLTQTLVI